MKQTRTATAEDLNKLSASCVKAIFGRAQEAVLDESYRKAGKMDLARFVSKLDSQVIRVLPRILPQLLKGENAEKGVEAELYKLNVYSM